MRQLSCIKVISYAYPTVEEAQDALHGVASIDGYLFGYVDEDRRRTVTFHGTPDSAVAGAQLPKGLESVFCIIV